MTSFSSFSPASRYSYFILSTCPVSWYHHRLFTLDLVGQELEAREITYIKHGSVNSWLTSEVFELQRAYSIEAESALIAAKELQLADHPDPEKVKEISDRLIEHLPAIDPFWPRWKFFAEKHGVNL